MTEENLQNAVRPGGESVYKQRFEQIADLTNERDKYLETWFRWLIAIAVGCLSVLIPLSKTDPTSPWATGFFRSTCVCMGIGIVALSIRIYAFHFGRRSLIAELVKSMETLDTKPVTSKIPNWMLKCEGVGYVFLLLGVCCLITFACIR